MIRMHALSLYWSPEGKQTSAPRWPAGTRKRTAGENTPMTTEASWSRIAADCGTRSAHRSVAEQPRLQLTGCPESTRSGAGCLLSLCGLLPE